MAAARDRPDGVASKPALLPDYPREEIERQSVCGGCRFDHEANGLRGGNFRRGGTLLAPALVRIGRGSRRLRPRRGAFGRSLRLAAPANARAPPA